MNEKGKFVFGGREQDDSLKKEENTSLDETLKRIYALINEMDRGGYSFKTTPIKKYLMTMDEESGSINPARVYHLEKLVNRIYFEDYLDWLEKKNLKNLEETDPTRRILYKIPFEGQHFGRLNYIAFTRDDPLTWSTSPAGWGYTTTCDSYPPWVNALLDKITDWRIEGHDRGFGMWSRFREAKGKILGLDVEITECEREHENGHDCFLSFRFASKEDADRFSEFLFRKAKESPSPDRILRYLRNKESMFNWDQFYLIDPKYRLLNTSSYSLDFVKKYEKYGIDWDDLSRGVNRYIKERLIPRLFKLTEEAVKKAKEEKSAAEFESLKDYYAYLAEARFKAINWQMLEELLKNHEEEIIELARKNRLTNSGENL